MKSPAQRTENRDPFAGETGGEGLRAATDDLPEQRDDQGAVGRRFLVVDRERTPEVRLGPVGAGDHDELAGFRGLHGRHPDPQQEVGQRQRLDIEHFSPRVHCRHGAARVAPSDER